RFARRRGGTYLRSTDQGSFELTLSGMNGHREGHGVVLERNNISIGFYQILNEDQTARALPRAGLARRRQRAGPGQLPRWAFSHRRCHGRSAQGIALENGRNAQLHAESVRQDRCCASVSPHAFSVQLVIAFTPRAARAALACPGLTCSAPSVRKTRGPRG